MSKLMSKPIKIRYLDDNNENYEILSGHNRVNAAKKIGLNKILVIDERNNKREAEI